MTEAIGTHYTETYKLRIQILILKSIGILGSLKHVINIILQIRYIECYMQHSILVGSYLLFCTTFHLLFA
jgi:hypothetical protein